MALNTTTWRGRNRERLERTRDIAINLGKDNPVIIDYGPRGLVNFLFDCLPEGRKQDWNVWEMMRRGVVKPLESALRKTNLFDLITSEPEEIANIFSSLFPEIIYVVDKEIKVIEAARKAVERSGTSTPFDYRVLDIDYFQFSEHGDIVIAYQVANRTINPRKSFEHIVNTTRPGGLLSTTVQETPEGFERIGDGIYQRVSG